jgi:serine/threonine-protein kinase
MGRASSAPVEQVLEHLRRALPDHYLLDREIGHGGMATVYLAQDLRYGRKVAVKVLRPELAALIGPDRFLREIQTTARLTHPNIVTLHDSGQADRLLYYVMPYVEGETLRDRIRREGPLPLEDALRIASEVADALEYAHRHGVVHRDVKPANILLSGEHALVADFGLAKALAATTSADELSHSGIAVGTPEYMAPEQAGSDSHLDGRADVYALGCVLFEMLAGEPPFQGTTAQTILAKHRLEPIPSVRVLRPDLPAWVEDVVRQALAKTPADRYRSAAKFHAALVAGASGKLRPVRRLRPVLLGVAVVVGAFLAWRGAGWGRGAVDSNKVVVFPLVERGTSVRAGTGQEIALMIGSALEHTEPLKWLDGWTWLDSARRTDASLLAPKQARTIARRRLARYYLDGVVIGAPDSTRVILRLNDAGGDSLVAQATVAGAPDSIAFPQLGLRAINQLLPRLLQPGRRIDLKALAERSPAAIANWLQGEREYRHSRYTLALEYQRRAVGSDSMLAFAALKGALAAEWDHQYAEAAQLVELALRNASLLPPKYVHFAEGLQAYFDGAADSASRHVQEALRLDSTWSEAWMTLGEVRYHLFADAESLAAFAFTKARRIDPDFAPPLFHLAEIELRNGHTAAAAKLIDQFRRTDPDSLWLAQLSLTLDCLRNGPGKVDWAREVAAHPVEVVQAAKVMGSRGSHPACAEAGFRAVFTTASAPSGARWGAVLGLQGILTARNRLDEVKRVLDSAVASGLMAAKGLYVIHAVAGSGMDAQAGAVIAELAGDYDKMSPARLWYHGVWLAHIGDRANLSKVAAKLSHQAESSRRPLDVFAARSIAARLALLDADTSRAIALLEGIGPAGSGAGIEWGMEEPFGQEQLLLAELLLTRGRAQEALEVATGIDHPRPITYLVYLRPSLLLRIRAAESLRNRQLAGAYEVRVRSLK